jgi:hypothetical protein
VVGCKRWPIALIVLAVGCSSAPSPTAPPTAGSSTSTAAPTTTSVPASASARYIGSFAETPPLQIDLSLYFNLPSSANRVDFIRPRALYQVSGRSGYSAGSGFLSGNVTGTLDGTPENGTFSGIVTANMSDGCIAQRNYSGPVTRAAVNWTPGDRIQTCGTFAVLTSAINAVATSDAATTSITTTTVTTTSSTTTTAQTTTSAGSSSTSTVTTTTTTSVNPDLDLRRER